jgi:hypothetical protein
MNSTATNTTPRRGQQRDKPFRDALRMEAALAERSEPTPAPPGSLRSIARNLLDRADRCTLAAREVADRLDGKPGQALEMQTEIVQHKVSRKPMSPEEWAAQYCGRNDDEAT